MPIASFLCNRCGPSDSVRFRQIVGNFIDFFNILPDKSTCNADAVSRDYRIEDSGGDSSALI